MPKLEFSESFDDEILFSDFENESERSFTIGGTFDQNTYYPDGDAGKKGLRFDQAFGGSGTNLSGEFVKRDNNYTFSAAIKSDVSGQLTIVASANSQSVTETLSYTNTSSNWETFDVGFDLSLFSNETLVSLYVTSNVNTTLDNVLFSPSAMRYVYSYVDPLNGVTELYNNKGLVQKKEYDQNGQLSRVYNHLNDVVEYYEYPSRDELTATFSTSTADYYDEESVTFTANTCANATFLWTITNTGNQTNTQLNGREVNHIFTVPGDYTIKLEASDNNSSVSDSINITVNPHPIDVTMCMAGPSRIDLCQTNSISNVICNDIGTVPIGRDDPTHFKITFIDSSMIPFTYQWQFRTTDNPNNGWSNVGTNSNSYSISYLEGFSYEVRCVVTDAEGHQGITTPMQVEVFESTIGCTL